MGLGGLLHKAARDDPMEAGPQLPRDVAILSEVGQVLQVVIDDTVGSEATHSAAQLQGCGG
eukprot:12914893-Prorocentrum_lima.AAC.1